MRQDSVHVLADPALGALYGTAIEAHGYDARRVDSYDAFVAGITEIWRIMS
jgi:2-dehydro-3-deoxygalactonokinase